MEARFRADYPGEFVIVKTTWSGGKKEQVREWIENPIVNQHISGRAACIGDLHQQSVFDVRNLQNHRGGLLGSKKLQVYGTGEVAEYIKMDFAVECHTEILERLLTSNYAEDHIVYSTARMCIEHPGKFYLIPYNPMLINRVLPVYLAAFDGHKEIFLIGYDKDTQEQNSNWIPQLVNLFRTYTGVRFYLVGEPTNFAPEFLECSNVIPQSIRDFVGYCDV